MISRRFEMILSRVTPTSADDAIYLRHRHTVQARLKAAFATNRVEVMGSYARGSGIRKLSDIDLLLVLSITEVRQGRSLVSSRTVLDRVRRQLQGRFVQTDIGRDGQAVVLGFAGGGYSVEVVPGVFHGPGANNYPTFSIPDGEGGWMLTSPHAHNRYLTQADQRSGGKLRRVVRLIKFWRACRAPAIPLNSFHVELLLAAAGTCVGVKSYGLCLAEAFALLNTRGCAALRDPVGISGLIPAAGTLAKRQIAARAVAASADHAARALTAAAAGQSTEAARQWGIVFNGYF